MYRKINYTPEARERKRRGALKPHRVRKRIDHQYQVLYGITLEQYEAFDYLNKTRP
jgi:hypothetical protein